MSGTGGQRQGFLSSVPVRVRLLMLTQVLNSLAFGYLLLIFLTAYLVEINVLDALGVGLLLEVETLVLIGAGITLLYFNFRHVKPKG
jgi:hypothetical protein